MRPGGCSAAVAAALPTPTYLVWVLCAQSLLLQQLHEPGRCPGEGRGALDDRLTGRHGQVEQTEQEGFGGVCPCMPLSVILSTQDMKGSMEGLLSLCCTC